MDFIENERRWADQLRNCSLVVELEYEDQVAEKTLQRIGYLIARGDGYAVETGYLASLLVGLNYVASAESKSGEMWPQIMEALNNLPNTAANQERITKLHRKALSHFGLQRFEHPLGRIGEMQIHAGIPIKSQEAFIRKLTKAYKTERDFNASVFNEQVRALPKSMVQAKGLDAPTWHFINQAGNVADDFVANCIEVLDDMQDGSHDQNGGKGLPPRIIKEIVRVVSEQGSLQRAKGTRVKQPRIVWDRDVSGQIEIELPNMPEHESSSTVWVFEFSDKFQESSIGRTLPGLAPTKASFPLREITPSVSAKASVFAETGTEVRNWNLSLFQEDAPVLIFNSDGVLDRQKGPLEPEVYRLLVPRSYKNVSSRVEVDGPTSAKRIDCPLGWGESAQGGAWEAFEVSLGGADTLKIFVGNEVDPVVSRAVSVLRKPSVSALFTVEGLFDEEGNPIHSSLPIVAVPNNGNPLWRYELRDIDNRVVFSKEVQAVENKLQLSAPDEIEGRFELQVTQGFGSTLRQKLTIVPGIETSLSGETRKMSEEANGLSQVSVSVSHSGYIASVNLSEAQISKKIVDAKLAPFPIIVRPNYERFELLNSRSLRASEWITPTRTHIEDLPELQFFANIFSPSGAELHAIWPDRTLVSLRSGQTVSRLRFNLAELSETANQKGAFELILKTPDGRALKAGNCSPRKMFTRAQMDPSTGLLNLDFPGESLPSGLEICFYASRAPWIKPISSPLSSVSVSVPEELLGYGDVQFTVALSDPWVASSFSETVELENPNTDTIPFPPADPTTSPDHALAHWLTTGVFTEEAKGISIDRAWQCMLLDRIKSGSIVNRNAVREFATSILSARAKEALISYPDGLRGDESYLKHLITTELVSLPAADTKRGVAEFSGKPFLACMLTSSHNQEVFEGLEQLAASFWGLKPPPQTSEEDIAMSTDQLLLKKASLFGPLPNLYANLDDEALRAFLDQYLPGTLFEGGTMAKILHSLAFSFERASEYIDPQGLQDALSSLSFMDGEIHGAYGEMAATRPIASKEVRAAVRKNRGARILTLDVPAASIRLAMLARLNARDHMLATGIWKKHKFALQQISAAYPELAELDLTIAELYLKVRERPKQ